MENYYQSVNQLFKEIILQYNLRLIQISSSAIALVGWRFAIILCFSLEGVDLDYVIPNTVNELDVYHCNYFWGKKFDENDRKIIIKPSTIHDHIMAELETSAKGLANHWDNVLSGDKGWINEFKNERMTDHIAEVFNKVETADYDILQALKPTFDQQANR
jgi:hypothetical protein